MFFELDQYVRPRIFPTFPDFPARLPRPQGLDRSPESFPGTKVSHPPALSSTRATVGPIQPLLALASHLGSLRLARGKRHHLPAIQTLFSNN